LDEAPNSSIGVVQVMIIALTYGPKNNHFVSNLKLLEIIAS